MILICVLEGDMRNIDACDIDNFSALDNSDITIAILGNRGWPQKAKQERDKVP